MERTAMSSVIDRPSIEWRDLAKLTRLETAGELLLPLPALLLSWEFASAGLYPAALACSFYFFLCGLRQAHDCFHHNWPVPLWLADAVMMLLSVLMLGSMHAVRLTHLRHHARCLSADDVEAASARMTAIGALLIGPRFPLLLHGAAWRIAGRRQRRWIGAELTANVLWLAVVVPANHAVLRYHLLAMLAGQCLTAFFAVWTVHHDCPTRTFPARTLRCHWKSLVAADMFFHFEHHLFPRVPTRNLPALARRLDLAMPGLDLPRVY
jgi:fatty acid desaturase